MHGVIIQSYPRPRPSPENVLSNLFATGKRCEVEFLHEPAMESRSNHALLQLRRKLCAGESETTYANPACREH